MKSRKMLYLTVLAVVTTIFSPGRSADAGDAAQPGKTNVLVIMVDDLGYQDLGFQASPVIQTPHLDALAMSGTVFTDAHTTASVCSPSRAGFMTGRYQQRFGHEANSPPGQHGMAVDEFTIGQAFQSLGYQSFVVGKWHLGNTDAHYPTARGFDEFWGLRMGSRSYWYGMRGHDDKGSHKTIEHNGKRVKFEGYLTDRLTDQAIRMMNSTDDSFFMFLSYTAPHAPWEAEPEDLKRADDNPYRAMIQNLDHNIGRVVEYLELSGLRKNTMIWFLSDNGGIGRYGSNIPLNGMKGIKFEGGQRVPFMLSWPGKVPAGEKFDGLTSSMDIFATSFQAAGGTATPKPLDGVDLIPFLNGQRSGEPHEQLFWRKLEGLAVRSGDWKLIKTQGLPVMLYNLRADLGERKELAKELPEKVTGLLKDYGQWEQEMIPPLWQEGEIYVEKRRQFYLHFRDANGPVSIDPRDIYQDATKRKSKPKQ